MYKRSLVVSAMIAAVGLTTLAGCSAPASNEAKEAKIPTFTTTVDEAAAALVPATIRDTGKLNCAVDAPYGSLAYFVGDQMTGMDPSMCSLVAQKLDLEAAPEKQAFDTVIPSLQAGKHDVIMSGMNDTLERQQTLNFVEYLYGGFAILVKEGNPDKITGLDGLCGVTVSIQKATSQGDMLREMSDKCVADDKKAITITELPGDLDAQTALKAGKSQAYVADAVVGVYAAETTNNGKAFDVVADPANPNGFNAVYSGIGILNTDQGLTDAVFAAMESLIADGSYLKMMKHFGLEAYAVDKAMLNAATE